MRWIDDLGLPPESRVLELGCGAGPATLELCRRGFAVEALDSSIEMVAPRAEPPTRVSVTPRSFASPTHMRFCRSPDDSRWS